MKQLFVLSLMMLMPMSLMQAQDTTPVQSLPAAAPSSAAVSTAPASRMELSFGYFSYNDVLHNMPGYAEAEKHIASLRATYQQELKRSEEEFSRQYGEFIEGQQTFPENILLKRQKELEQLMDGSLKFRAEARQLLEQSEADTMKPLKQRVDDAVARLGMERGYAFILDTDKGSFPFVSGTIGTDVTADLLMMLK